MYTAATVEAAELALKDLDARRGTQPVRADAGLVLSRAFAVQGTLRSSPAGEG